LNKISCLAPTLGVTELIIVTDMICGLYHKPITIINDDSSIVDKLETSVTVDARVR
jgi:hypothetical protein